MTSWESYEQLACWQTSDRASWVSFDTSSSEIRSDQFRSFKQKKKIYQSLPNNNFPSKIISSLDNLHGKILTNVYLVDQREKNGKEEKTQQ